jgi:hypothetical protein
MSHRSAAIHGSPVRTAPFSSTNEIDEDVRGRLRDVVDLAVRAADSRPGIERRAVERIAYPHTMSLTPVNPRTHEPVGETRTVLGKHLSCEGFGFASFEPFHFRFAIVSLEVDDDRYVGILGEALWCKFSRHGWYETGGRFHAPVRSPLNVEES